MTSYDWAFGTKIWINRPRNASPRIRIDVLDVLTMGHAFRAVMPHVPFKVGFAGGDLGVHCQLIGYAAADNGTEMRQTIVALDIALHRSAGGVAITVDGRLEPLTKDQYGAYGSARDSADDFTIQDVFTDLEFRPLLVAGEAAMVRELNLLRGSGQSDR